MRTIIEKLENEIELASSDKYELAVNDIYGIVQVYTKSINSLIDMEGAQITTKRKNQIIRLCTEFIKSLENQYNKVISSLNYQQLLKYRDNVKKLINNISNFVDKIKDGTDLTKQKIMKIVDELNIDDILDAELPKSLIASIALANPLTALIYQNQDLIRNKKG